MKLDPQATQQQNLPPPPPPWFVAVLGGLYAGWDRTIETVTVHAYWRALHDCNQEWVRAAVDSFLRGGADRPPSAGQLRQAARQIGVDAASKRGLPPPSDPHGLRMGAEVSAEAQRLKAAGMCWICSVGEAISVVAQRYGGDPFDWREPGKHACDVPGRPAPPDRRLPREPGEDDGD